MAVGNGSGFEYGHFRYSKNIFILLEKIAQLEQWIELLG